MYIASIGANLLSQRMKVARALWTANISAEYSHQDNPRLKKQLDEVLERAIPFMVVFGTDEVERGTVKVKDVVGHNELEIPLDQLVATLLSLGCRCIPPAEDLGYLNSLRDVVLSRAEDA